MAQKPATRLRKLQELAAALRNGETVTNRTLKTWLGDAYGEIEDMWQEQLELRADLLDKPASVTKYQELLREATFYDNRQLAAEARGHKSRSRLEDMATSCYEKAFEHLEEEAAENPSICEWFDRPLVFEVGGDIAPEKGRMPQVVTSRSAENTGGGILSRKRSKAEIKAWIVERTIERLTSENDDQVNTEEQVDKRLLDSFLNAHMQDDI